MVGKRKKRDEETEPDPSSVLDEPPQTQGATVFVSNLPYSATSVDLQTLFSDIAPVRSAFVVLDRETRKSKGVGYVSFALREDAKLAVSQIHQDGIVLDRRSLRVQFAESKPHEMAHGSPVPKAKKPRQPRKPRPTAASPDPLAIRTIVISGLPPTVDSNSLWKKIRKINGAEKILHWPVKTSAGEDPTTAQALFSTPATAQHALSRLHGHVFKGSLLSVVLKKRLDILVKSSGQPTRASRLIVRNVPWNVTEHDLRCLFLPYGPVYSISIPVSKLDEDGGKLRAKGFAFVWMMSKQDAEKAIEGANGSILGGNMEGKTDVKGKERVIAVDWALSKERWEVEKEKIVDQTENASQHSDAGSGSSSESEASVGVHGGSDEESDSEEDEKRSDDNAVEEPRLPPPETGNTLFIRNVPFTATEDELRKLFRSFGPLRYARITQDAATGRSRGTGFVCFWNKVDVDRAIQQAELLTTETGGTQLAATKKNPFKLPSILTPDPSSSLAQSLVMHGRTLDITRAVTREEAGRLRELGEKQREKQDKRNLYLMREGVIFANTPAASTLSETELEQRVQAFNGRRMLMRSNPSLFVSKSRLSVRQLPTFVTERTLKRLAIHAVRAFEEDVFSGVREGLSEDELRDTEPQNSVADGNADAEKPKKRRKRGERATAVRQAKIVRLRDRVDPLTGKGRSKGYGFLEMMSHADALRVLRWANNNPEVEGLMRDWWTEEVRDLVKKEESATEKSEEGATKLRRLKDRLQELEGAREKKTGRTLVLEFSIENVQVVRRRAEREDEGRNNGPLKPRERQTLSRNKRGDAPFSQEGRPTKMARTITMTEVKMKDNEGGKKLGGLIGRKRKERKSKAGGR